MAASLHILGVPVRIDASLVLVLAVLGFELGSVGLVAAWVSIGVLSVLVHELGHAMAYRAYGQRAEVLLYAMGGLTRGERGLPPARSLVVSLAGPASELVLLGVPSLLLAWADVVRDPFWVDVLALSVYINVGWPLLNLVPILPLDGGNAVSSVAELVRPGRGQRIAQVVSVAAAGVVVVLAIAAGWVLAATFVGLFGYLNLRALRQVEPRRDVDPLVDGYAALLRGDVSAGRLAATRAPGGARSAHAEELRLWSLVAEGDARRAERALALGHDGATPSALLRGAVAVLAGRTDEGLPLLTWSLANEAPTPAVALAADVVARADVVEELVRDLVALDDPVRPTRVLQAALHHRGWHAAAATVGAGLLERSVGAPAERAEIAVDVAASAARAGDVHQAERWLGWAVRSGWRDVARLEADPDLEPLRAGAEADALRRLVGPR